MRLVPALAALLSSCLLLPAQAAELSAEQVGKLLGVPIAKLSTERNRAQAQSTDTTYETAKGDAAIILHRGPVSNWAGVRDAVAAQSEPFPGLAQAFRVKKMNMVCALGGSGFVCITPSIHYLMSRTQPGDEALRALIKAAL
jgi:hypothetical protein